MGTGCGLMGLFRKRLPQPMNAPPPDLADPKLPCSGCAHSAAGVPYPGHPSGERPCCFCVRNPNLEEWVAEHEENCDGEGCRHPVHGFWYDGSKSIKTPMDNYLSLDRLSQLRATKPS